MINMSKYLVFQGSCITYLLLNKAILKKPLGFSIETGSLTESWAYCYLLSPLHSAWSIVDAQ